MRRGKSIIFLLSAILGLGITSICGLKSQNVCVQVSANSAQAFWSGVTTSGIVVTGEECPLVVQHEKLVFDLQEFPKNYYISKEEFLKYSSKVTARYTFYNPADYTVKATLMFPFGTTPSYGVTYGEDGYDYTPADTQKYGVTVNGESTAVTLRHTLSSYGTFDIEKDIPTLADGYVQDEFYAPTLPVYAYTYKVDGVDTERYHGACVYMQLNEDKMKTRAALSPSCMWKDEEKGVSLGEWVENGKKMTLYVIGEPLSTPPNWKFYEDDRKYTEIYGEISLVDTHTFTFEDLAFTYYPFMEEQVSRRDWYNAVVDSLNLAAHECRVNYHSLDIRSSLMRWYEYEMEVLPKSTVINEVTAPMYPSIDLRYSSPVLGYTYLLSPAKTWKDFGTLDIEINTPYYLINDTNGFTKTQTGYTLSSDGLLNGELWFSLSAEENPQRKKQYGGGCGYGLLYAILLPVSCIGGIVSPISCSSAVLTAGGVFGPIVVSAVCLFLKKRK